MAFELQDGQATLHKNKFKEEGGKQPDYKGDIMINGEVMELAAWIKEGGKGKWMSLKYGPKRAKQEAPTPAMRDGGTDDEALPF